MSISESSAYTNIQTFHKTHRADWDALEQTLKAFRGVKSCTAAQLDDLHTLYLKVSQHVSICQTYFPQSQLTAYLNDLAARAHNTLYKGKVSSSSQIRQFFAHTFVELFWERRLFIGLAALLFLFGGLIGFLSVYTQPESLQSILPGTLPSDPEALREGGFVPAASMSSDIMTNNIRVAILAFAGGATLGLYTIYLLIMNGITLGALACYFWQIGASYEFWAYIMPHGVIELTAIFIAGGAGLLMGYKVLVPRTAPRSHQFITQAAQSCLLLLGTIPLFIIAGLIEGFITPAPIPLEAKYLVAILTVVALILYVTLGRKKPINR